MLQGRPPPAEGLGSEPAFCVEASRFKPQLLPVSVGSAELDGQWGLAQAKATASICPACVAAALRAVMTDVRREQSRILAATAAVADAPPSLVENLQRWDGGESASRTGGSPVSALNPPPFVAPRQNLLLCKWLTLPSVGSQSKLSPLSFEPSAAESRSAPSPCKVAALPMPACGCCVAPSLGGASLIASH